MSVKLGHPFLNLVIRQRYRFEKKIAKKFWVKIFSLNFVQKKQNWPVKDPLFSESWADCVWPDISVLMQKSVSSFPTILIRRITIFGTESGDM